MKITFHFLVVEPAQVNESDMKAGCTTAFAGAVPGKTLVVGTPFLRRWFTSYVYDEPTDSAEVGIAKAVNASAL